LVAIPVITVSGEFMAKENIYSKKLKERIMIRVMVDKGKNTEKIS